MKNLFSNIWNAPGSSVAGAVVGLASFLGGPSVGLSDTWSAIVGGTAVFVGFFSNPKKK